VQLRTRIAITFLLLLAGVLAIALVAVSRANRGNAERELQHQLDVGMSVFERALETDRRQLTLAADVIAADAGFRAAVATRDDTTLTSVLENSGERIKAAMVVLTTLDGTVMAASGSHAASGRPFPVSELLVRRRDADGKTVSNSVVMVEDGHIYQLVAVVVRNPLPVAWVVMGFELDRTAAEELGKLIGLGVTFAIRSGDHWIDAVPGTRSAARAADLEQRTIVLADYADTQVNAILSKSLADARAPFERLTQVLYGIAAVGLVVSAYAAFWLARNITRPLRDLILTVDQIRGGAYDVPVTVHRDDEIGQLAEGLQVMQAAVRSRDQSIRRFAYEDPLTGLLNRAGFSTSVGQALSNAETLIGVAVINVHRFRHINEHLGYAVGDAVLRTIAARLLGTPALASRVARLAADQFAAFTPLQADLTAQAWGLQLLARLSEPIVVQSQPIDINATLGLAVAPQDATLPDELLRCADLALDRARRDKRSFALYEPSLKPAARDQLSLLGELRGAVERDELRLYFQPKIELASGRIAGAEVLLRWAHPTRGLLGPGDFISFAEKTGFIRQITRWTLEHAVAQGADWYREGMPLPLAINVTVDDINDPQFHLRVANSLARNRLPPSLLTLEVTESGFINDPASALAMLDSLAALGVSLSIDDFGTGYSSLSHLARMPVHEVKIDRSFVLGLESDPDFASIVRSAIDMGHALGLKVVAEGIENESSATRLRKLGCDVAQGYLYAKPLPKAELLTWLAGKARVPVLAVPSDLTVEHVADTAAFAFL
jgi:diguanylate cyclase (GGDEF)-like protein